MKYTAGSLFSGIGGLDLAASLAGFDIQFHVEIDEFCRKVLNKHASRYWPNAATFTDVRTIGKHNLPKVDCLFGGFPCQDVSVAGNRAGIREGTRSGLWFEFRRVISELRPSVVLLENVPGILTRDGCVVIADLAALGYVGRWGIISASDVGAPHQRERWFCVAYASGRGYNGRGQRVTSNQGDKWRASSVGATNPIEITRHRKSSMGDTDSKRSQKSGQPRRPIRYQSRRERANNRLGYASNGQSQPRLGRTPNGLPGWLDFPGWPARPGQDQHAYEPSRVTSAKTPDRAARLKALGNAVVPQVAYPLFVAIHEWLAAFYAESVA